VSFVYNPQSLRRSFPSNSRVRATCGHVQLFWWACSAFLLLCNFSVAQDKPPQNSEAPACIKCHRTETLRYLSTAMGKSFRRPDAYPNAVVKHQRSGSTLSVQTQNGTMIHRLQEDGFTAEYPIPYEVGEGCRAAPSWFR
jgi:hypothetical protein